MWFEELIVLEPSVLSKSKCLWIIDDNATWFTLWADIGEGTRRSLPLTKEQFEAWLDAAETLLERFPAHPAGKALKAAGEDYWKKLGEFQQLVEKQQD